MNPEPTETDGVLLEVEQDHGSRLCIHVSRNGEARAIVEVSFGDDAAQEDLLSIHVMRRFGDSAKGPFEPVPCRLEFTTDC